MNPYLYVLNNPLKYVDSLGLMFEEGPGSSRAEYNAGAVNKQSSKKSNPVTKVSNQVQKQETKNRSKAFYGNLSDAGNSKDKGYLEKSINQVVRGNYADDVTLLGTGAQVGLGVLGLNALADIRDLTYDFTNWEWS